MSHQHLSQAHHYSPQAVWECHTEDDKIEIWMCGCVFIEMQMELPHGCVHWPTPFNNDCNVWQETQEEREPLNTHRLDQNWQCHPPKLCVNFRLPWLKLATKKKLFADTGYISSCASGGCLDFGQEQDWLNIPTLCFDTGSSPSSKQIHKQISFLCFRS